jgi:hypothetical protein
MPAEVVPGVIGSLTQQWMRRETREFVEFLFDADGLEVLGGVCGVDPAAIRALLWIIACSTLHVVKMRSVCSSIG